MDCEIAKTVNLEVDEKILNFCGSVQNFYSEINFSFQINTKIPQIPRTNTNSLILFQQDQRIPQYKQSPRAGRGL